MLYFQPPIVTLMTSSVSKRHMLSSQPPMLYFQPPSPAASTISILNDDTTDLIERLADVQQDKWLLEERVSSILDRFIKRLS